MSSPTAAIAEALSALDAAWGDAPDTSALPDATVKLINERVADLRRRVDGLHARVAAEVAARSRPELGTEGLARKNGFRTPAKLIAEATGGHTADAVRLIQVGQATAPRMSLSGEILPAKHPHIAAALDAGSISVTAAGAITTMLDRVSLRLDEATRDHAEKTLARKAPLLTYDELLAVLRRAEAHLDPDGLEPRVTEQHGERSLKIAQDAAGMTVLTARLDPESAAPVVAAIEAIVTHQLRTSRGHNAVPPTTGNGGDDVTDPSDGADDADAGRSWRRTGAAVEESRSLTQMRADALAAICRHAIGCDRDALPSSAVTVVVRMTLDDVRGGAGVATIDGMEAPIDAGSARRMSAAADIIPCVLGTDSEVLDWGRAKRHFTSAQRLILVERDGGCSSCHLPPAFTEAHHIQWWERDSGPTDLDNAILLCTSCHHRVHADGWEIRIDTPPGAPPSAGTVWFIPPPHVDPTRTPRLGGRRRFDPLAWGLTA
ncbi:MULTISPECIES: HNH endonuclease [Microbacterium]|uniref:HNH endonuclease n=1 Tax=Microbacterium wangchenii TaxID=2541726 RepID=A0ABX5SVL3_9MICO|nr:MULTISPECIES: HNH endonuclease signature motif containing protein [Microbacterium]MCK6067945.1 HNH endonuclease [Microbacterium sp. EYE_512]QBR89173.1 HNH endonuclease [Microbacterium wangchenii]